MIIIGAGLTGSTIARVMAEQGIDVTVLEKNNHIGGAIFDYFDEESKMYIHQYGPHIFHTSDNEVFEFISKYGEWEPFTHRVVGVNNQNTFPIPFNFNSIDTCFSDELAQKLKQKLRNISISKKKEAITIGELLQLNDEDLKVLAEFVYENVFLHYTEKQWGMAPDKLGDDVMGRVPIRLSYEDAYFADVYQLMPSKGYATFIDGLLDHNKIMVQLNIDADQDIKIEGDKVFLKGEQINEPLVYCGCIDKLLKYCYGVLPYRTLRFELSSTTWPYQDVAVVNYPNAPEFTRITEFGHFYPLIEYDKSMIMKEFPLAFSSGDPYDPYYPIPLEENKILYRKYLQELASVQNFYPAGRLGTYQYINMDVAIRKGLDLSTKIFKKHYSVEG